VPLFLVLPTVCNLSLSSTQVAFTEIPYDFIPTKATIEEDMVNIRFTKVGYSVFQKHALAPGEEVPHSLMTDTKDYKNRLENLKLMVETIGVPCIEDLFMKKFNMMYPDYTYGHGQKVKSVENMVTAYSIEPYNNLMREMVHYCMHGMWANNAWALEVESKVLGMLRLAYTEKYGFVEYKKNTKKGLYSA
jgi:hypothetical protein